MSPIYFYLVGLVSGVLCTILALNGRAIKKYLPKRVTTWSKIENMTYERDFDYNFKEKISGQTMLWALSEIMKNDIEKNPQGFETFNVEPGDYKVSVTTRARFVKRD